MQRMRQSLGPIVATVLLGGAGLLAQKDFVPDTVFKGGTLAGWHVVGRAAWTAQNGTLQGKAAEGDGWLVSEMKLQDVRVFLRLKCAAACNSGVLLRAEKTKDGGLHGVYLSLADKDLNAYDLTLDADGKEVKRVKLAEAPPEVVGISGPAVATPAATAATAPARPRPRRKVAALAEAGSWNSVELIAEDGSLNGTVNDGTLLGGAVSEDGFGAVAIYVGKGSEVRVENLGLKDINSERSVVEATSSHFTKRRISDFYYGWSAVAADTRHNGTMDVVSGPFVYLGPEYTVRRRYRAGREYNPSLEYAPDMVNFAYDFNGDGFADVLASDIEAGQRPIDLYTNPGNEARKWTKSRAVSGVTTEIVLFKDIDGDGKPEILYGGGGQYWYAKPDAANALGLWKSTSISGPLERVLPHGMGVGDINGDGRMDLVVPNGWYEQPAAGQGGKPWKFHEASFGGGGAEMGVYDVNGDGLPDVVTSLEAHGFGLAWFEQKRAADGAIAFERHDIAGDFSTKNAGDVVFSQPHATAFADMDGDGIPDMVVGKSMYHHLEGWGDPDPYGPAMLYVYRTVQDKAAPGGARFVPELVDNHSGVGSAMQVVDLNHDGAMDIVTQSVLGTFVFYGHPGRWTKASSGGVGK